MGEGEREREMERGGEGERERGRKRGRETGAETSIAKVSRCTRWAVSTKRATARG